MQQAKQKALSIVVGGLHCYITIYALEESFQAEVEAEVEVEVEAEAETVVEAEEAL